MGRENVEGSRGGNKARNEQTQNEPNKPCFTSRRVSRVGGTQGCQGNSYQCLHMSMHAHICICVHKLRIL